MKTTVEEIHIPIGDGKVESIYFNEFVTKEEVIDQLKATAKETTLLAESEAIKQAIASAKPEVDLSGVAQEATLTSAKEEIIEEVSKVSDKESAIDELLAIQLETIIG